MGKKNNLCLYLFFQKKLLEKSNLNNELMIKDARQHLCNMRFTKQLHPIILKELEKLNLIKKVNRYKIKIINKGACKNIEDVHALCSKMEWF